MKQIVVYMQYDAIVAGDKMSTKNSGILICNNKKDAIEKRKALLGHCTTRIVPWEPYEDINQQKVSTRHEKNKRS